MYKGALNQTKRKINPYKVIRNFLNVAPYQLKHLGTNYSLYIFFRNVLVQINVRYCKAFCSCVEYTKCFLQQFCSSIRRRKVHVQKQNTHLYTVPERNQWFKTNISPSASIGSNPYFQLYIKTKIKV